MYLINPYIYGGAFPYSTFYDDFDSYSTGVNLTYLLSGKYIRLNGAVVITGYSGIIAPFASTYFFDTFENYSTGSITDLPSGVFSGIAIWKTGVALTSGSFLIT